MSNSHQEITTTSWNANCREKVSCKQETFAAFTNIHHKHISFFFYLALVVFFHADSFGFIWGIVLFNSEFFHVQILYIWKYFSAAQISYHRKTKIFCITTHKSYTEKMWILKVILKSVKHATETVFMNAGVSVLHRSTSSSSSISLKSLCQSSEHIKWDTPITRSGEFKHWSAFFSWTVHCCFFIL